MDPGERLDRVQAVVAMLIDRNQGSPVLVEGEKDEAALRALGLEGRILRLNRGVSVWTVCESLRGTPEVIVLTDWDRKGGQLARLLREGLAANGVRGDFAIRKELATLAHVRAVEGLPAWIRTLHASVSRVQASLAPRPLNDDEA
ncbi:MAG: toprim domain-containing protein [Thermoplasmatota archaeon]